LSPSAEAGAVGRALDELIDRFGAAEHEQEIAAARAEYDERRGVVFEDEELYEAWTQAFLEWYVLERVGARSTLPPAGRVLADETDPSRIQMLRALLTSHRSLFEVGAAEPGRVELTDMIGGGVFVVDEQRELHGVERGDVLETRLVGLRSAVHFARTFCYHPPGTRQPIAVHVARWKLAGKSRLDILDLVASLKVRTLRYSHLSPEKVYERPELST